MASLSLRRRFIVHFHRRFCSNPTPAAISPTPSTPKSAVYVRRKIKLEHNPDAVVSLIGSLDQSPSETASVAARQARDMAVQLLAKYNRTSDIESLLEGVKKQHPQTENPESFLNGIIFSYGKAGMVDHAIRTFDELESLGICPSRASFNSLLNACSQGRRFDKVPELFRDVPARYPDISPDEVSYNILAKAHCEMESPEAAYSLLKEMEEKGIEVSIVIYTTILDGFYKKNEVNKGDEIWDLMREKGVLDATAYNVYLAQQGTPEEILELFDEMGRRGIKPDVVSYNLLLTCYCKNGKYEEGKKVYKELKTKGCNPNAATFGKLLFYSCQTGDLDTAMEVLKKSIRWKKVPDYRNIKILVQALAKESRNVDAKWVIAKMKERYHDHELVLASYKKLAASLGLVEDEEGKEEAAGSVG